MRNGLLAVLLLVALAAHAQEQAGSGGAQVNPVAPDDQRADTAAAPAATAPPAATEAPAATAGEPNSDAFDRACIDLLHGRTPEGEKAIRTLREACSNLMAGRAEERLTEERRRQAQLRAEEQARRDAEARVAAGQAAAPVESGQGVRTAFGQAASELTGRQRGLGMGMTRGGPVGFTIVTNPVGWFSGLGVNASVFRAFEDLPKFSWIAGARYSRTDATNGKVSTFGAMAGVDWFIVGRNNEGLRLGPRAEVAAGREEFGRDTTFARLGLGGELGYNFIASNGITALIGAGLGGRVAGDSKNDDFASFVGGEFGPYVNVGLGYSW